MAERAIAMFFVGMLRESLTRSFGSQWLGVLFLGYPIYPVSPALPFLRYW